MQLRQYYIVLKYMYMMGIIHDNEHSNKNYSFNDKEEGTVQIKFFTYDNFCRLLLSWLAEGRLSLFSHKHLVMSTLIGWEVSIKPSS